MVTVSLTEPILGKAASVCLFSFGLRFSMPPYACMHIINIHPEHHNALQCNLVQFCLKCFSHLSHTDIAFLQRFFWSYMTQIYNLYTWFLLATMCIHYMLILTFMNYIAVDEHKNDDKTRAKSTPCAWSVKMALH